MFQNDNFSTTAQPFWVSFVFIQRDQNYTHWILGSAKQVCLISSQFLKCTQLELYQFVFKDLQICQVVTVLKYADGMKTWREVTEGLWLHEFLILALDQWKRPQSPCGRFTPAQKAHYRTGGSEDLKVGLKLTVILPRIEPRLSSRYPKPWLYGKHPQTTVIQ
jgi:hypothetical protein